MILLSAAYGIDDVPEDVSCVGLRGTLKSPPIIIVPIIKGDSTSEMALKNDTGDILYTYR